MRIGCILVCLTVLLPCGNRSARSQTPSALAPADGIEFFETRVRPLLAGKCYDCHGPEQQESGLRLDQWTGLRDGGGGGPPIVPGKPGASLLITAVRYQDGDLRMPPTGKLATQEIADLERWVAAGAPHPDAGERPTAPRTVVPEEAEDHWAFRSPRAVLLPRVQDTSWPTSPIDCFVLARLEAAGLAPAPPADRRTLLRRVTFDLWGLPPTPAELDAFLADEAPGAFARVVDRLLASPRYGERWGRHWLDVARYADSNGLDENIALGNAWRYRDWVVTAWNADQPYDRFLVEQLAGDLLTATELPARYAQWIATGFLTLGPKVLAEVDERKMEMDIIDEQVDTLGRAVLGLTLGCARCHDHKFDPLTTRDYYALAGIFKSTRTMEHFTKIARWFEHEIPEPADLAEHAAHASRVATLQQEIAQLVAAANDELRRQLGSGAAFPEKPEPQYPEATRQQLQERREALAAVEKSAPVMPTAMGVTEGPTTDLAVHVRGSHLTLGDVVPRGVPGVLRRNASPALPATASGRLELAQWLTTPDHPLTSRVLVNRIWRWHFGRGLVPSTDNFGLLGEQPTHPELLDWLAVRFAGDGWSIKSLHRLILLSSTYQMSSRLGPPLPAPDPENQLLSRAPLRRLEAEALRDAVLYISGQLQEQLGGSLLQVKNREFFFDHTSKDTTSYDSRRRSLYLPVVRNNLYDGFQLFDYTDAGVSNGDRATTTVPTQALFMMNSDLLETAAGRLAEQLSSLEAGETERVRALYLRAFGREPSSIEQTEVLHMLDTFTQLHRHDGPAHEAAFRGWQTLCHAVLAANEFIYVR